MSIQTETLKVACYCIFKYNNKYLIIKRGDTNYMNDYYSVPAGKIDEGEDIFNGIIREMKEELNLNLQISDLNPKLTTFRHKSDYVDVFIEINLKTDKLDIMEPNKITETLWLDNLNNLPEPFVPHVKEAFEAISENKIVIVSENE